MSFAIYCQGDGVRENKMGGACSMHGRYEKLTQIVGKPDRTRLLAHRWEGNIKVCIE